MDGIVFTTLGFMLYRLWRDIEGQIATGVVPNMISAIIWIITTVSLAKLGIGAAYVWTYRPRATGSAASNSPPDEDTKVP